MALLLIRNNKEYQPWIDALQKADPTIEVVTPETIKNPADATMAITWKAPKGSYAKYPNLKVIGSMGAGVDHLFEDESLPEDVILTRVVDEKLASDMQENTWKPTDYKRAKDVTAGILGFGTLGQAVGTMLKAIGFNVIGWSSSEKNVEGIKSYTEDELNTFLSKSEILVCLLPLTENTKGILNEELFNKLPQGAYLINVARGGHLVDDDLIEALNSEHLSGAALDVFHTEPLPEEHPFWQTENIIITPHIASMSNAASVSGQVAENYQRMQNGEQLLNQVQAKKGY